MVDDIIPAQKKIGQDINPPSTIKNIPIKMLMNTVNQSDALKKNNIKNNIIKERIIR